MKRVGKEPRLLPNVMEAIASLKEKQGSTQKQIIDHIAHYIKRNKDGSRNVTVQVRRALEHGLHSGLIRQRSGKFTLGLDRKDYAIFRRFRQFSDPLADCNSCKRGRRRVGRKGRRGRRRRSRRRGRRGRRRPLSNEDDLTDDTESGRSVTGGTPEPMDRGRRRRRRGRKGRRRGRRGRRRAAPNEANSESSDAGQKESNPTIVPEKRRSEQDKVNDYQSKTGSNHNYQQERHQERNHQERNQNQDEEDNVECGNPECLCSVKPGDETPRCISRENNYYNDSYLN